MADVHTFSFGSINFFNPNGGGEPVVAAAVAAARTSIAWATD